MTEPAAPAHTERDPACSFCGERKDMVSRVFGGPGVYYCMVCLAHVETLIHRPVIPTAPSVIPSTRMSS